MQLWIWQNISIELPEDWEMLQYSREPEDGVCAFADRYQFRLELNWKQVAGPPDFERMLGDYQKKLRTDPDVDEQQRLQHRQWQGLAGRSTEGPTARFGRFFEASSRLLEIVFLGPERRDPDLEAKILDSVAEAPRAADRRQRWRAFGMDLTASAEFELEECRVEPAAAMLAFAEPRQRGSRETFERLGLLSDWLQVSVPEWLAGKVPDLVGEPRAAADTVAGHHLELLRGTMPALTFPRVRRQKNSYQAAAWICPRDERLYCVSSIAPYERDGGELKLAGHRLSCCSQLPAPPST